MTAGPDRPRRIVGCCKAVRERVQVGSDAGLRIIGHDRGAPCRWSGEDYVGGTPVEHPRHGSTDETGTVLDQARSNSWMVTICWSVFDPKRSLVFLVVGDDICGFIEALRCVYGLPWPSWISFPMSPPSRSPPSRRCSVTLPELQS